jgi:hypothetical protein
MIVCPTLYVIIEYIPRPGRTTGIAQASHEIMGAQQIRRERGRRALTLFATANTVLAMHCPQKDLSVHAHDN